VSGFLFNRLIHITKSLAVLHQRKKKVSKKIIGMARLQELAVTANSTLMRDHMLVYFEREVAK
jgi:hypothetical protein